MRVGQVVDDVAERVAGGFVNLRRQIAELDLVAFAEDAIGRCPDTIDFLRADDLCAGLRDDLRVSAGMVGVPMGVPDLGDGPAFGVGFGEDAGGWRENG